MTTTLSIKKWGNSQAIRLPKKLLKQLGIKDTDKDKLIFKEVGDKIIVEKSSEKSNLMQRFEGYDYETYLKNREVIAEGIKPTGRELF